MQPLLFLVLLAGPCLYAIWTDLSRMIIPNHVVIATVVLFLAGAPFVMGLEEMAWRFLPAALVLLAGFLLHLTGQFGAGDAKFAAAIVLFVPLRDLPSLLWIYAILALVSVGVLHLVRRILRARGVESRLKALAETRTFPLGIPLALTALVYQILAIRHYLILS
ncbi:MAG: membrane protein [Paracoccaceae bacterium]|nr:MAG: membrane protein [Paracoccaceae bacterium]